MLVFTNEVNGRSRRPAAAAAEFTTYDVTEIQLYSSDGQSLDTTEMTVLRYITSTAFCVIVMQVRR